MLVLQDLRRILNVTEAFTLAGELLRAGAERAPRLLPPEANFVDGTLDDLFAGGQESIDAEYATYRGAQFSDSRVSNFVFRLRGEHQGRQDSKAFVLSGTTLMIRHAHVKTRGKGTP